jgi:hypothetical protein
MRRALTVIAVAADRECAVQVLANSGSSDVALESQLKGVVGWVWIEFCRPGLGRYKTATSFKMLMSDTNIIPTLTSFVQVRHGISSRDHDGH